MKKRKNNITKVPVLLVSMITIFFPVVCFSQNHDSVVERCMDEDASSADVSTGDSFVICIYKRESDLKVYRFKNQKIRVTIKSDNGDVIDCSSSTKDTGVAVCEVECDPTNKDDRRKRTYEVTMLDMNSRLYYISKKFSTGFMEMDEDKFQYRFKFKNCKAVTDEPLPNNIYILYRSRELDNRINRQLSRY